MHINLTTRLVAILAIAICNQVFGQQGGFGDADVNQDRKVDAKELKQYASGKLRGFDQFEALFAELDVDGNGFIDEQEFQNRMAAARRVMRARPQPNSQPGDTTQANPALKVGDAAPLFKLKSLDGKSETELVSFKGKKPVVLIFGSYT